MENLTTDEQKIVNTVVEQAKRSPGWKVQKLVMELRRRIDKKLPIPASGVMVRPEVGEAVLYAIQSYTRD